MWEYTPRPICTVAPGGLVVQLAVTATAAAATVRGVAARVKESTVDAAETQEAEAATGEAAERGAVEVATEAAAVAEAGRAELMEQAAAVVGQEERGEEAALAVATVECPSATWRMEAAPTAPAAAAPTAETGWAELPSGSSASRSRPQTCPP